MGIDTAEDELTLSSKFDAINRRNKIAHDITVAPYFMAINKSHNDTGQGYVK